MDNSKCIDYIARYSALGFGVVGFASMLFAKKASRFNWMLFGTGIGAGAGAFSCNPALFQSLPKFDFTSLYKKDTAAEQDGLLDNVVDVAKAALDDV
jgi:hypothetical protein